MNYLNPGPEVTPPDFQLSESNDDTVTYSAHTPIIKYVIKVSIIIPSIFLRPGSMGLLVELQTFEKFGYQYFV